MQTEPIRSTTPPQSLEPQSDPTGSLRTIGYGIRSRMLGGLMLVLPIAITLAVLFWLYSFLEHHVIGPLARLVLWKVRGVQPDAELPAWFEYYAAPVIGVLVVLLLLYGLGFVVHSWMHRLLDWVLLRVPGVSVVYNGVRKVLETLDKQRAQQKQPQRVVLVGFPHPGMKVPAFVTATCRDRDTQKSLLCVYVPTTPVPTSGYFLLVPEDEVVELDWTPEQALQAIISGGLTAPPEVRYYNTGAAIQPNSPSPSITRSQPP